MTVYGPDITAALQPYATQFDDLKVQEREPIFELNAINPLSDLRERYQNVTSDQTEHLLQTTAGVDEQAYLETVEHGEYTAGYEAEAGIGVRIPQLPENDEELTWGYYSDDTGVADHEPQNGWYFGVDAQGVFVAEVSNSTEQSRVYQPNWNQDTMLPADDTKKNPSGLSLDLTRGNIFQIKFVYYGYGPVKMQLLTDEGIVTVHEFYHDGRTSVENTNLPIEATISNNGTNADGLELYVGGRQFSIIGQRGANERRGGHYRDELTGVDDTQWYAAISAKIKDGSDIGAIDFEHLTMQVLDFEVDTDNAGYRWQIRRGTILSSPTWQSPSTHETTPNETAMKIDTTNTTVNDGNGDVTGVFVDGGTLGSGSNNTVEIQQQSPSGSTFGGEVVTLLFQAVPGDSGTLSEIFFSWQENW